MPMPMEQAQPRGTPIAGGMPQMPMQQAEPSGVGGIHQNFVKGQMFILSKSLKETKIMLVG